MRVVFVFSGVFCALVLAALVASGGLLQWGIVQPLAHQRIGYIGGTLSFFFVVWTLVREFRR